MNKIEQERNAVTREHEAWIAMFHKIAEQFGVSENELNSKSKYGNLFVAIEKWGIAYTKSMAVQSDVELREDAYHGLFQANMRD